MNSTTMPSEPKAEVLVWLTDPALAIKHDFATPEDLEDAAESYRTFLSELDREWPSERVRDLALAYKREQYAKAAKYIIELELKNKDARAAGLSFKEREEKYAKKIRTGHKVLQEYKAEGLTIKTQQFLASQYVKPTDMLTVIREGFEKYVVDAGFFDYPQESPKDLTLTSQTDKL